MKKIFVFFALIFVSAAMLAQSSDGLGWGWEANSLKNSDMEGTDFSGYAVKPNYLIDGTKNEYGAFYDDDVAQFVVDGEGVDGSKCIKVVSLGSKENPAEYDWDSQFWIRVPEGVKLNAGDKFYLAFDYRATWDETAVDAEGNPVKSIACSTQAHGFPGNYHHWNCLGDIEFTDEWQHYEGEVTVTSDFVDSTVDGDGFQSIAINFSQNNLDFDAAFFFDNVIFKVASSNIDFKYEWLPIVVNGDFEGDGTDNFIVNIYDKIYDRPSVIEEGVGVDGSRGIKMVVPARVENTWDSQLFIQFNEPLAVGDIIKVSMDIKATKETTIISNAQYTPGHYNHWNGIGDVKFTKEWSTHTATVTVDSEQSKEGAPFWTIALYLAENTDEEVTFYFDNISVTKKTMLGKDEDPNQIILEQLVATRTELYNANYTSQAAVRAEFEAAYEAADNATGNYVGLADRLKDATSKYRASMADYMELQAYIQYGSLKVEQARKMGVAYADLAVQLEAIVGVRIDAYAARVWGREEIYAHTDKADLNAMIVDYVSQRAEYGTDFTILLGNPNFEDYAELGANAKYPGWEGSGFSTGGGTAGPVGEVWNQSGFDTYVEFAGLPEGYYLLSCDGGWRIGEDSPYEDYRSQYDVKAFEHPAYLYAETSFGTAQEQMFNIAKFLVTASMADKKGIDYNNDCQTLTFSATSTGKSTTYYFPDQLSSANQFIQAGYYKDNMVIFRVGADGKARIGVKSDNSSENNWVFVDNFKLTYYNEITMSLEQIRLGRICDEFAEKYDASVRAEATYKQEYADALEAAQDAYENGGLDDFEYEMRGDAVRSTANNLLSSIYDYYAFWQHLKTLAARVDELSPTKPACAEALSAYYDEALEAYNTGAWNREQIDQILDNISAIMGQYADQLYPGDDVSWLLNNTTFDTDFSGWLTISGNGYSDPWWGPEHTEDQRNLTGTMADYDNVVDGFLPSGNAECWHQKFDMYQKVYNMPAGLFNVTCQAFSRKDGAGEAYIYAILPNGEEVSQKVMDIWDDASDEKLFENTSWASDVYNETLKKYAPYGMGGANFHFEAGYYKNTFSILLREPGDIQIGIKTDSESLWVLFDNFKITYEGTGARAYLSVLEEETEKVETKAGGEITDGCYQAVAAVLQKAQELVDNIDASTEDECVAMLEELKAQHAVISENILLQEQVLSYTDAVDSSWDLAQNASPEVKARFNAVDEAVNDNGYVAMDNDELKALLEEIGTVLTLVRIPDDYSDASDATPVDFTGLIENPRFHAADNYTDYYFDDYVTIEVDDETGEEHLHYNEPVAANYYTFKFWKGHQFDTGGGDAANCGEVWNYAAFDAYMEFTGLPEGTYELSCDGFYNHGNDVRTSAEILAGVQQALSFTYLYATSSIDTNRTQLNNMALPQITEAEAEAMGIDGEKSAYKNYVYPQQLYTADQYFKAGLYPKNTVRCKVGKDGVLRIGVKKEGSVSGDWVVVDNFQLLYYGNTIVGDVNEDGKFTPIDISLIVEYVLGKNPKGANRRAADANLDGAITPIDISLVVPYVLAGTNQPRKPIKGIDTAEQTFAETLTFDGTDGQWLRLGLTNSGLYTAVQFDVHLPEGARLAGARMAGENASHAVAYKELGGGLVRVLAYSGSNVNFSGDSFMELLIEPDEDGQTDVAIDRVRLVGKVGDRLEEVGAQGISLTTDTTGIEQMAADRSGQTFNLSGQRVGEGYKGIVVENGKKYLAK